jgi:cytochrome c553
MNSSALLVTHIIVVNIFLLIYFIKTILIFSNQDALVKFSKAVRVPEMIVSALFLVTGVWLFAILGAIKVLQIVKLALVFIAIPIAIVGYKKMNKVLALLSFIMIVAAYGLAEMARAKPYLPKTVIIEGNASDESMLGIKIFGANCSMCHGMDGKKEYRNAANLSASQLNTEATIAMINDGSKRKMPAFKNVLSADEIAAAAKYVQTLKGK